MQHLNEDKATFQTSICTITCNMHHYMRTYPRVISALHTALILVTPCAQCLALFALVTSIGEDAQDC